MDHDENQTHCEYRHRAVHDTRCLPFGSRRESDLSRGDLHITTLIASIRSLVYYISMARHMVGGRTILYRAIIMLDLSLFTLSLTDVPLYCIVLYLAGIHIFAAFVDIMRCIESMRLRAPSWRMSLISGVVNLFLGVLCIVFIENVTVAVGIYSLGLAYSGMIRIIQAFRKNKTLYGNAPAV